ncbi:MAG: cupin domain-containing protein [Burkholderiales bacterium]
MSKPAISEVVFSADAMPWRELKELPGARGYEYKALVCDEPAYTEAYSCELVRLDPNDHSVPHKEPWNHTLIFLEGTGNITIEGRNWPVGAGSVAKVKAGQLHALTNAGPGQMLILAVYDPPRPRERE